MGCHFLLQGMFLTQGSNLGLLHCRHTLYRLRHQINCIQRGDQADRGRESPQRLGRDPGAGGGREALGGREGPPVWGDKESQALMLAREGHLLVGILADLAVS